EIDQFIREMRNEGELVSFLDQFIEQKNHMQSNYKEALTNAAKIYLRHDDVYKNNVYSKVLEGLSIEEIPEFMVRAGLTEDPIPLHQAASFRGSLNMRMRQKQLDDTLPEWHLDDKRLAYHF